MMFEWSDEYRIRASSISFKFGQKHSVWKQIKKRMNKQHQEKEEEEKN